jgi:hypothetical protein
MGRSDRQPARSGFAPDGLLRPRGARSIVICADEAAGNRMAQRLPGLPFLGIPGLVLGGAPWLYGS